MKSLTPILCTIAIIAGVGVFAAAASTSIPGACAPAACAPPAACDQADGSTTYVEASLGLVGKAAGLIPGHARRAARRDARHQKSDAAEYSTEDTEITYVEARVGVFGKAVGLIPGHARRAARRDARHQK